MSVATSGVLMVCTYQQGTPESSCNWQAAVDRVILREPGTGGRKVFTCTVMLGGTAGWDLGTSFRLALDLPCLEGLRRGRVASALKAGLVLTGPKVSTATLSDACDEEAYISMATSFTLATCYVLCTIILKIHRTG